MWPTVSDSDALGRRSQVCGCCCHAPTADAGPQPGWRTSNGHHLGRPNRAGIRSAGAKDVVALAGARLTTGIRTVEPPSVRQGWRVDPSRLPAMRRPPAAVRRGFCRSICRSGGSVYRSVPSRPTARRAAMAPANGESIETQAHEGGDPSPMRTTRRASAGVKSLKHHASLDSVPTCPLQDSGCPGQALCCPHGPLPDHHIARPRRPGE